MRLFLRYRVTRFGSVLKGEIEGPTQPGPLQNRTPQSSSARQSARDQSHSHIPRANTRRPVVLAGISTGPPRVAGNLLAVDDAALEEQSGSAAGVVQQDESFGCALSFEPAFPGFDCSSVSTRTFGKLVAASALVHNV